MAIVESRLMQCERVAEGTMAFHFSKPAGFRHEAGQSVVLTLVDPPETDGEGDSRAFTIASAPHEPELMIATRMRDTAFKRILKTAQIGTAVRLDGPNGAMVLHDDVARPAVFLAGGIGITPFLAIVRHVVQQQIAHRIHLFYANRRPEDAAFLSELQEMEQLAPGYRLIAVMSQPERSALRWSGETGHIRRELLVRHLTDLRSPMYYFAGPPAMTMAMRGILQEIGVGERAMRYEEFYGY
ncbi:FAD-dependent oxidoreductase [Aromatoleum evansii]|uniref:FAD-dependent oxidoreductase n=1 Tax=Aromatoleum evansii TaxID=59406 RepID=A0ABZ1AV26_AROEV|nr:FAD-dependent oxidoreductase [Aromatoleum evansii]